MKQKIVKEKPLSRFEVTANAAEQSFMHNDSRVIVRRRDVLLFELSTVEEHLVGLRASTAEVTARKERLEAQIDGLRRVLSRR